ncbi:MAG: tetratricopeptide repeat protein [Limnospira sp.]
MNLSSPQTRLIALVSACIVGFSPILVAAAAPDPRVAEAQTAFEAGVELVREGTPEALQIALTELNTAVGLYRELGSKDREAETLWGLGLVYDRLGDLRSSLDAYKKALDYYKTGDRIQDRAYTLNQIGRLHYKLGDYQQAIASYQQAISDYREGGDKRGEAYALNGLGAVYEPLGNYQAAIDTYTAALELHRQIDNREGLASTFNNLGLLYDSLGEYPLSFDYYRRSLTLWQQLENRGGEAVTLNNIGLYYDSQDNHSQSLYAYQKALLLYREKGDRLGMATTLNNIGYTYTRLGNWDRARTSFEEAEPLWKEIGNRSGLASTLNNIGVVSAKQGDFEGALQFYSRALALRQEIGDRAKEALSRYRIAIARRSEGDRDAALVEIEAAIAIIEDLRTNVVSQELRTTFFASKQEYYEFYIDLLMELHGLRPDGGYDAQALEASERAKARSLLDLLAEMGGEVTSGVDPQLLERKRQQQQQLAAAEERRIQLLSNPHTAEQKAAIEEEIDRLLDEYRGVLAEIRAESPRYAALTQPAPLSLAEIRQQVLDEQSLLLAYSVGERRSFVWAVTSDSLETYELPGRQILETATQEFRDSFILSNLRIRRARAETAATELGKMLLAPVADYPDKTRLLVAPDAALQYVPFVALSPSDGEEYRPLIVDREVVTLPSASTLAVLRREIAGRKPAERTVAVLADPVFSRYDERVRDNGAIAPAPLPPDLERSARESGVLFDRLPYTLTEAEQILALVPPGESTQELGFSATRDFATSGELSRYRILHFATHGLLNSQNPELSGLVLSLLDSDGEPLNGFLRLHDIFNLNLPADLVVLSACETGLGQEVRGEGLVGLTRGFMYAGAARVVVSLWAVDDRATAELMGIFYRNMIEGDRSPSEALRQAQIEIWRQSRWHSPYYWAGFTIQGEWNRSK